MKILFAVQGTGNGHVSRAREIIPYLNLHGSVDVMISGTESEVDINYPVKYKYTGLGYVFGKKGGIDLKASLKVAKPLRFLQDLWQVPLKQYDLIVNDFEPLTAWAAKIGNRPIVSISHQAAFLSANTPRPKHRDSIGEMVLKNYAPCKRYIGIHFSAYDNFIETPVIRKEIRTLQTKNKQHITVYLPAYKDEILIKHFLEFPQIKWHIFSKRAQKPYEMLNISVFPVNSESYTNSLQYCSGLLTGAGFEAPAEALFLGKKLMVIPMKNQYEQWCNAEAMSRLGVDVVNEIDENFVNLLANWLETDRNLGIDFPDNVGTIVDKALNLAAV